MDERTQMIVEVDGVEEIRDIDHVERPYAIHGDMPLWIKHPVLQNNEVVLRAFPDKVMIVKSEE
jgi:hypothetical protein